MFRRSAALLVSSILLSACSGCTSIIKRVYYEAKGASSKVVTVPGSATSRYADFQAVELLPARTELGTLVTKSFEEQLRKQLKLQLTKDEEAPFKGEGPVLTLDPQVYWYNKGGIKGAFPNQHAVVLFFLRAGPEQIGKVQVATKSEAARTDDADMAESMAKGLAKYFGKFKENRAKGIDPPPDDEIIEHSKSDDEEKEERRKQREKEAAGEERPAGASS